MKTSPSIPVGAIDSEILGILAREGEIAAIKRARELCDLDLKTAVAYVRGLRVPNVTAPAHPLPGEERPTAGNATNASNVGAAIIVLFFGFLLVGGVYSCNHLAEEGAKQATVERAQAEQVARDNIAVAIREHRALIGMSQDEAKKAWGYPSHVNKSNVLGHLSEQWVYNRGYLYFDGDTLTSIQETTR